MEHKITYSAALIALICISGIIVTLIERSEYRAVNANAFIASSSPLTDSQKDSQTGVARGDSVAPNVLADYSLKSPFTAVRWDGDLPVIRINRQPQWYALVSMDGFTTDQVIGICKAFYRTKWKEGFESHLVEVFERSGYPLGDTTTLKLINIDTKEKLSIDRARVTVFNQNAVFAYRAANDDTN